MPCCMRWALRATSGGAPEVSRGRSRGARGALGDLSGASGDGPGTPESDLLGFGSDFGDALGDASKIVAFSAVLASIFRRLQVDSLLASVLVSVALESLRGKSDTLEFDDPYEGFATFPYLRKDATAKRTCRKTYEFRLRARSAN